MSFDNSRRKFTSSLHSRSPSLYFPPPSSLLPSFPPETEQTVKTVRERRNIRIISNLYLNCFFSIILESVQKEHNLKQHIILGIAFYWLNCPRGQLTRLGGNPGMKK